MNRESQKDPDFDYEVYPTHQEIDALLKERKPTSLTSFVTVAPYFRSRLNTGNKEEMIAKTKAIRDKAQKLASSIGLGIVSVKPMGGTYLGSSEISWLYEIEGTDQEKIDLFAALMGDLSNEYQDAVIAANYVGEGQGNAIELVYEVPIGTTIENIEKTLQDLGIEGSSFKFDEGTISIIAFSKEELKTIGEKFKNTNYKYEKARKQNSRYLDNGSRQNLYRTWLGSKLGVQNRSLYNACSKALAICEATEKVEESQRLLTAQMPGEKWDQEHGVSQKPFQETQRTISYTPKGKRTQVYTVEGTHIYNRDGKEVYIKDSVDRNKIFANLAVKSDRCRCIHFELIYI